MTNPNKNTAQGSFAGKKLSILSKRKGINSFIDWCLFLIFLVLFSVMTLRLFDNQTLGSEYYFKSDMAAYIRWMLGTETEYSFPYPIFFKLGAFFYLFDKLPGVSVTPAYAIALSTMTLNSLAVVITKAILNHMCIDAGVLNREGTTKTREPYKGFLVTAVTFSLFFVSMIYRYGGFFPGIPNNYLGVFSPTPWHNATYMAARPFMILAFIWGGKLLATYESGEGKVSEYIWFSIFMLLVTMTKPSYTIVHLGAAGLVMVYRILRSRFQNLRKSILLGLCYIPTFLHLLYQYSGVFTPAEGMEGGIGFGLMSVWGEYTSNLPLAVILGMAFPLLVLLLHIKKLKEDQTFRFGWQVYGMGLAMAAILYEKGFRMYHFNFSWGYMAGMFVAFLVSSKVLLEDTFSLVGGVRKNLPEQEEMDEAAEKTAFGKKTKYLKWFVFILQWLVFLLQLYCGVTYFMTIWAGGSYY